MKYRVALFDADGVLTLPEEMFSVMYARSRGLDVSQFDQFFREEWPAIVIGKKDLKQSVDENTGLWQWPGSSDELLDYWFKTEDVRNNELLAYIAELTQIGVACYLATDQEKYRGAYMQDVMFKGLFSGYFISSQLGVTKSDSRFFELVLERLSRRHEGIKPEEVVFFDDSQTKVDTACSAGITGYVYEGAQQVMSVLSI